MKMGRPPKIYLPLPYCKNGHRRTAKNTRWVTQFHKYEYRIARCALCDAEVSLRYWHRRRRMQIKVLDQQPLQIDGGGAG